MTIIGPVQSTPSCRPSLLRVELMNGPSGQQCLAKARIHLISLWWFNANAYNNETWGVVQDTHTHTHGQYAMLRLARFTEPLPDNKDYLWIIPIIKCLTLPHWEHTMALANICLQIFLYQYQYNQKPRTHFYLRCLQHKLNEIWHEQLLKNPTFFTEIQPFWNVF